MIPMTRVRQRIARGPTAARAVAVALLLVSSHAFAALPAGSTCPAQVLAALGWRFVPGDGDTWAVHAGTPCERADLAEAHAAGVRGCHHRRDEVTDAVLHARHLASLARRSAPRRHPRERGPPRRPASRAGRYARWRTLARDRPEGFPRRPRRDDAFRRRDEGAAARVARWARWRDRDTRGDPASRHDRRAVRAPDGSARDGLVPRGRRAQRRERGHWVVDGRLGVHRDEIAAARRRAPARRRRGHRHCEG